MTSQPLTIGFTLVLILCSSCAPLPPADIPPATYCHAPAVIFDIDGTLTPRVSAIFTARPDAAKVVKVLADKGFEIFYLSARMLWLSSWIPNWLQKNGFPAGGVHVAQTREDRRDPAQFKTRKLKEFIDQGWSINQAYGDSSTDFEAYTSVGIPKQQVFALLRSGDTDCQPGDWATCLKSWSEHLDFVNSQGLSKPNNWGQE